MKKLIAFSVIFALLAGAVFALDLGSFSAQTDIQIDLLNVGNGNFLAGGWESGGQRVHENRVRFGFSYETSGGEAGISGRLDFGQGAAGNGHLDGLATGWWKPLDIVRISLGNKNFGRHFGTGGMFGRRTGFE